MTAPALASPIARFRNRLVGAASRVGAASLALLLAALMPVPVNGGKSLLGLPSLCLFHNMTGLPCPGCGITRSVVCCGHLRFADSMAYHPLGPVVFAWLLVTALRRLPLPLPWRERLDAIPLSMQGAAGIALIVCLFAVWGARLAGWLPSPP